MEYFSDFGYFGLFIKKGALYFLYILDASINIYQRKRVEDGFWKTCEGKQVLNYVARGIGYTGFPAMQRAVFTYWENDNLQVSQEDILMSGYYNTL